MEANNKRGTRMNGIASSVSKGHQRDYLTSGGGALSSDLRSPSTPISHDDADDDGCAWGAGGEGGIIPSEYMMTIVIWLKQSEGEKSPMESRGVHVRGAESHRRLSVSLSSWRETIRQSGGGGKLWLINRSKRSQFAEEDEEYGD